MRKSSQGTVKSPGAAAADFIAASDMEDLDLHSVLLLRHGAILAEAYREPFDVDTPHRMYSVTKSFTSSAIGLAVAEGLLMIEDRVVDIFPNLAPSPIDANLAELRVKHLLTMSAEHPALPGPRSSPFIAAFLAERLALPPGSRFDYSNQCSYMLSAIVQRLTGEPLDVYLRPRLFEPLGIVARPWIKSEEGVNNGGWGLHLTTREMARFGQLCLQQGVWQGQRLLPAAWVDEATSRHVASWGNAGATDWTVGYGYQFWRGRHDSYRADGLLGQLCLILPKLDVLIAITAGTLSTQRILDLAWEKVLPALAGSIDPVPDDVVLAFPAAPTGAPDSPRASELDGITFVFGEPFALPTRFFGGPAPIVSARANLGHDKILLALTDRNATYRMPIGINAWAGGTSPLSTGYPEPYQGLARWEAPDRLVVDLVFTEGGFRLAFTFSFDPLRLSLKTPANPGLEGRVINGRPFP